MSLAVRAVFSLACAFVPIGLFAPAGALDVGDDAPQVGRSTLDGRFVGFADWYGSGGDRPVTIVTFFAKWCECCRKEAPELSRIAHDFGPSGLRLVAIGLGMDRKESADFAREHYGWRQGDSALYVVPDRHQALGELFGVADAQEGNAHLPQSFVIGRNRKILLRLRGFEKSDIERIETIVKRAVSTDAR